MNPRGTLPQRIIIPLANPRTAADLVRIGAALVAPGGSITALSIVEVPVHSGWVSKPLKAIEDATGTRIAFIMRFGIGTLPTASTVLQDGDQVFMLVTDEIATKVAEITGAEPANA